MSAGAQPARRPAAAPDPPTAPLPLLRRIAGERATERTTRVVAFAFLPGGLVFGALLAPLLPAQTVFWPAWWAAGAVVALVGPPVALGALAFVIPLGALRGIARAATVGTLLVLATAPLVLQRPHALDGPPWIDQVASVGLIAAVLAVRPAGAVAVAVAGAVLTFAVRASVDAGDATLDAAQNAAYVLLVTVTFIGLGAGSLAAARAADRAEEDAAEAATRVAVDAAREREQARVDGLVHDRVLATLLTAARRLPGSAEVGRRDAADALEGLRALLTQERTPEPAVDGQAFVWRAQGVTTELTPEAVFGWEVVGGRDVPGEAAEALLTATAEALRNSLRHAGPANRTVHVAVRGDGVEVNVLDDGVGFDPALVPAARLGVAQSIEGRMRRLPGGAAQVVSQPGVGTRVLLTWVPR